MPAPTSTEEFLGRLGHRYAATGRAAVGVLIAVIAPFAGPPAGVLLCSAVSALLAGWSLLYLRLMWSTPRTRYGVTDVAVMCALGLAQPWLVDPDLLVAFSGWVAPVVSFAVVALQWHLRPAPAAAATLLVVGAYVVGASASPEVTLGQAMAAGGAWMLVEAGLSRLLWQLVRRGGRSAGELMAARFAQDRAAELAAALRADQRVHWAAVHDTSASTLLMVGLGEVRGDEPWLTGQIARDVAALGGAVPAGPGDVAEALAAVVARSPLRVDLSVAAGLRVPAAVAVAVEGAVGEALENVRRHAGVAAAAVRAERTGSGVRVTVTDTGRGFDPATVTGGRGGLVVSVRERMDAAGGRAGVESTPSTGTRVTMKWPRG